MLTGKFKKQKGLKIFSQPLASVTQDGRNIELWFYRMLFVLKQVNITTGPMFVTSKGKAMSIAEMDAYFIPTLLVVQQKFHILFRIHLTWLDFTASIGHFVKVLLRKL